MSEPAIALAPLPFELVLEDGEPLDNEWHTYELPLLRTLIRQLMTERGRTDFYTGANQFVYYSVQQAREVAEEVAKGLDRKDQKAFRGPDVFWVGGVDPNRERQVWIAWEEGGRLPDVIFEFLSPSTARKDRTEKKDLYARVLRTPEYFMYDPETRRLEGFGLARRSSSYRPILPDADGRVWSEQLGVFVGFWEGTIEDKERVWIRLFRPDGSLVPTPEEAERQKADAERLRADAAEAELARLRALLDKRGEA
ncbi:MAG TPA: Uma2 family endonuclease [Thermoanaerobaculia bacterium]